MFLYNRRLGNIVSGLGRPAMYITTCGFVYLHGLPMGLKPPKLPAW